MICVSLANINFQECVKILGKTEYAEIRMDLLDLSDEQFKSLFSIKKKTIATCRTGKHDDTQRMYLLKLALDAGSGYIDIEYEAPDKYRKEMIKYALSRKALVIISYHNFENTPPEKNLKEIINHSVKWGADLVKITTTAQNTADCSRIMALYENHNNLIAFCMGKTGTITRVAAPLLGAAFTYCALDSKLATAPGQLTYEEMNEIYEIVGR